MKFTKRLLVAILALSILAASFVFFASAEGGYGFTAEGIKDIEDILEFYEYGDPIVNDLKGEENVGHEFYEGAPLEKVDDAFTTSVSIPGSSTSGYTVPLDENKVVFEFNVKFDSSALANLVYELRAKLSTDETADKTTTSLFVADLVSATPAFRYSVWSEDEGTFLPDTVALEGIAPEAGKWYSVAVFFNGEAGTYRFEVTAEGADAAVSTPELSLGNRTKMTMFQLRGEFQRYALDALNLPAAFSVKDVEIYGGTIVRNIDEKAAITAKTLAELGSLYANPETTPADKVRIAEVINTLKEYLGEDEINSGVNLDGGKDVDIVFNYSYATAVVLAADAIDTTKNYRQRMDHVADIDRYNEFVKDATAATPGISEEEGLFDKLVAAREKLEIERAALVVVHEQSLAFIEYMNGYAASRDYDGYVKGFYEKALADYPEVDLEYCELDGDMATVIEGWNAIVAQVEYCTESINGLKALNAILNVAQTETNFGTRYYEGYLPAKVLYEEIIANELFDYNTAAELVAEIAIYNLETNAPYMAAEEQKCLDFIRYVSEASVATYHSVLVERLSSAEPLYSVVQTDFVGINDAKAVYDSLSSAKNADIELAQAYIAKVNEVVVKFADANATYADKKAVLDAAIAAKESGNLFGYAGVKEANVALSEAQATILSLEGNSKTLIALVAQLDTVTALTERRAILRNAKLAAEACEKTYTGVAAALTKLDAAVADFNAAVDGANGALASAVENAANVASATVTDANLYKVASIIKDHAK